MLTFSLTMLTYLTFLIHIIVSNVEMGNNKCCPKKTLGEKEYVLVDYDEEAAELSGCLSPCVYTEVEDLEFKRICFKEGDLLPQCDAEFDAFAPPQDRKLRSASSESKSWMKAVDGNIRLHELSIPGTHNTMAWKGSGGIKGLWVFCQSLTLKEQLEMGVRFLDIRLTIRDGELGCYHGSSFLDNNFRSVLWEIWDFLFYNPTETVIFRFKNEGDSSAAFCPMFNDMIKPYRHSIWSYRDGGLEDLTVLPTLDQMRSKMVILNYKGYAKCFGYRIHWILLDNADGTETDPLTSLPNPDVVSSFLGRRRKRQVTDFTNGTQNEKAEKSHEAITGNQVIDTKNISTSISEDYLSEGFEEIDTITIDLTTIPNLREFRRFNNTYSLPREKTQRFWFIIPWIITAAAVTAAVATPVIYSYTPSEEYKKQLTDFQDKVRSSRMDKMMVNFASAYDWKCHPKRIAEDVNPHLYDYFGTNPTGRTGVVVFDYPTNWHHDLMKRIYQRNFKVCAQVYEHGNYEGDSYQLQGEHNDLAKIGWDNKISSIRVFPGCRLHWYEHPNFQGGHRYNTNIRTYTIGWTSMSGWGTTGNDKVSSLKCEYH